VKEISGLSLIEDAIKLEEEDVIFQGNKPGKGYLAFSVID
jgi:hypothetical protein